MELWSCGLAVKGGVGADFTVLLTTGTGNRQLTGTGNRQLKQDRNVKWQDADQTAFVVPRFVEIKASVRGAIG